MTSRTYFPILPYAYEYVASSELFVFPDRDTRSIGILSKITAGVQNLIGNIIIPLPGPLDQSYENYIFTKDLEIDPGNEGYIFTKGLERLFLSTAFQSFDVNQQTNFAPFLFPNERNPIDIKSHLDLISAPGVLVSTGTERSFFDLALMPKEKCQGLIVRDINPKVKAYVDFNTMLLRVSRDRKEYVELSSGLLEGEQIESRIEILREKIITSGIPHPIKKYYLKNLNNFAEIYFSANARRPWKDSKFFEGVKYFEDDSLFANLQRYAREGNIIATIGDINDLSFLGDLNVSVVDTSNIHEFQLMEPKGGDNFHPRVIWTNFDWQIRPSRYYFTRYYSYTHKPSFIDERKKREIDDLFKKLVEKKVIVPASYGNGRTNGIIELTKLMDLGRDYSKEDKFDCKHSSFYSERTLTFLRDLFQKQTE